MWAVPWILVSLGVFYFVMCAGFDLYKNFTSENSNRFEKIYGDKQDYFSRMSQLDVKRWLVFETYNREVLGFKGIDDVSFENLK